MKWEKRVLLVYYLEQGFPIAAIARELGVDRRTVHRWKAAGYTGGLTQLKVFVQEVRPRPEPEPVVRFETEPGHQAQVDFAHVRFPWGKRFVLLVVLGYSRLLWVKFYSKSDMRVLISGLEEAFAFFGGVPRELLFDQMASVITADLRDQGDRLIENAEFLRFSAHWGFRIRAGRPYRAQTKGKVERPVRYLRGNFLYGREFLGDADLDAQTGSWLEGTANVRIHGTTKERPIERFLRDEATCCFLWLSARIWGKASLGGSPVPPPHGASRRPSSAR